MTFLFFPFQATKIDYEVVEELNTFLELLSAYKVSMLSPHCLVSSRID